MNLTDPSTLCLILLAVTTVFLLIRTRGQLARQRQRWEMEESDTKIRDYDEGPKAVSSSAGGLPDDLARWEVEMQETARQVSAQLDTKFSLLQSLIAEADRAAARLEDALDRFHPTLPPGSQAESLRPVAWQACDIRRELETRERENTAGESDLSTPEGDPSRASDRGRRREEIYRLADYGFATGEIARRVGSPVGEVELILSLRGAE